MVQLGFNVCQILSKEKLPLWSKIDYITIKAFAYKFKVQHLNKQYDSRQSWNILYTKDMRTMAILNP